MDPSYAAELLAFNKHTSDPAAHPDPFADPIVTLIRLRRTGDDQRFPRFLSQVRAQIAAMNHDTIAAALWALSAFDPALVHLAELREKFAHLSEDDAIRVTLDRLTSVYVEGQCRELLLGIGITTDEANLKVEERIGDPANVALHVLACTSDPLAMELFGYALWLGSLTAHGLAPWNRFKAVMADCYHQRHPLAVS